MAIDTCLRTSPASDTGWHSGRNKESDAEAVAGHQGPHSESQSQPPADVSDPPAQQVEEQPVECHTRIPRSRRPVSVEDGQVGDESSPLVTPGGIALSDSEKAEALADTLETQFQPVADPSVRQLLRWLTWR